MGRVTRYEFIGNWLVLVLSFVSVIFIPFGIVYFILATVKIEEEIENPNEFIAAFKKGKYRDKGALNDQQSQGSQHALAFIRRVSK